MALARTRINLAAITHNTRQVRDRLGPGTRLMAVVKADGYNHGAVAVAAAMAEGGADCFGVATCAEALALRDAGVDKPILAWIWEPGEETVAALAAGVELGVPSLAHLRSLVRAEIPARISLKVETGMHRSGVDEGSWPEAFRLVADAPHLTLTGVFSHLACADEPDNPANDAQAEALDRAIELGRSLGFDLPVNHLCNSPATLTRPDLHHEQVRVGLALYGLNPLPEPVAGVDLRPAMTWSADVLTVKPIAPGDGVSYGLTFTADAPGFTAVVPVGYADGLPRALAGRLEVSVGGRRYRQIGRVCMDQIVVDLGDNPHAVAPGDEAVIFGEGGASADELAETLGTINYEVACLPKGRTERVYEKGRS